MYLEVSCSPAEPFNFTEQIYCLLKARSGLCIKTRILAAIKYYPTLLKEKQTRDDDKIKKGKNIDRQLFPQFIYGPKYNIKVIMRKIPVS